MQRVLGILGTLHLQLQPGQHTPPRRIVRKAAHELLTHGSPTLKLIDMSQQPRQLVQQQFRTGGPRDRFLKNCNRLLLPTFQKQQISKISHKAVHQRGNSTPRATVSCGQQRR